MHRLIIIPEAFAGPKVYCLRCNHLYSAQAHMSCPACGEISPLFSSSKISNDNFDFDPFANDAAFQREFGRK